MDKYMSKIAVVTGSSSGIGAAISKALVKRGVIVVGLARRIDKLQALSNELSNKVEYPGTLHALKCDINVKEEIQKSFQWIKTNVGPVAILVNNAAISIRCQIFDLPEEDVVKMFDTNVKGLIMCTNEAVKCMIANSTEGHIININSVGGQIILGKEYNDYLAYSSSKHATRVLSEGLRREVVKRKENIKVTDIFPGLVDTEMTQTFNVGELDRYQYLDGKDVADACISVLNTPPHVLISELTIMPKHYYHV